MKKMMSSLGASLIIISCMAVHAEGEVVGESPAPLAETEALKPAESAVAAASEPSTGTVARGIFTSDVQNHEPIDRLSRTTTDINTVLFFTELQDFQGETVTHRWEYNGENMAEVKFQVGGPRWRVWSSKSMMPEWVGTWTVSVVNSSGDVVASESLTYSAAPEEVAAKTDATAIADNANIEADADMANAADAEQTE